MAPRGLVDVVETCVTCGEPAPAGATRCECGERLSPHGVAPQPFRLGPPGCTCGGGGICTPCVLAEYDGGFA